MLQRRHTSILLRVPVTVLTKEEEELFGRVVSTEFVQIIIPH